MSFKEVIRINNILRPNKAQMQQIIEQMLDRMSTKVLISDLDVREFRELMLSMA